MTIVEALACGLPVVASNAGGIPSAVEDGQTGLLVPLGNVNALAHAVERLLLDDTLRTAMAAAARQTAVNRFSKGQMIEATEQVLLDAMSTYQRR